MLVTTRKSTDKLYITRAQQDDVTLQILKTEDGEVHFGLEKPQQLQVQDNKDLAKIIKKKTK